MPVTQAGTREHGGFHSLSYLKLDCRCRVLAKITVDRGQLSEGGRSRSLTRGETRQGGNAAAQTPRSDQWRDSSAEVGMRSLSGPVLRDSLLPYAFLYALGAPSCTTGRPASTTRARQERCNAEALTATRSTASRKAIPRSHRFRPAVQPAWENGSGRPPDTLSLVVVGWRF